jgi:hypothetical protein
VLEAAAGAVNWAKAASIALSSNDPSGQAIRDAARLIIDNNQDAAGMLTRSKPKYTAEYCVYSPTRERCKDGNDCINL